MLSDIYDKSLPANGNSIVELIPTVRVGGVMGWDISASGDFVRRLQSLRYQFNTFVFIRSVLLPPEEHHPSKQVFSPGGDYRPLLTPGCLKLAFQITRRIFNRYQHFHHPITFITPSLSSPHHPITSLHQN
jgi:hypothetical protein